MKDKTIIGSKGNVAVVYANDAQLFADALDYLAPRWQIVSHSLSTVIDADPGRYLPGREQRTVEKWTAVLTPKLTAAK